MNSGHGSEFPDLSCVMRGDRCDVLMEKKVRKQYDKLKRKQPRDFGRAHRSMRNLAQFGLEGLPNEQFRWEGRFSSGVRGLASIHVGVIKGWQARFYGGNCQIDGRPAFVLVEFDRKQQDRADQNLLRSAARKLAPYLACS